MYRFSIRVLTVVVMNLALFASFSPDVQAQTKAEKEQAKEHFQQGAEYYTGGEYPKAIVEFVKGNALAPNAMFLYNISLSYAKLGNIEDALTAAVKAQGEKGMPDKVRDRNIGRIAAFRVALRAESAAPKIEHASKQIAQIEEPEPDTKKVASSGGLGTLGWSGILLTTVGAGLGIGAYVVAGSVQDDIDLYEAAAASGDREAYDRLRVDIESGQSTGTLLLYSGIGLGTAGIVMIVVDLMSGGESESAVYVTPTAGGTEAGYFLRF